MIGRSITQSIMNMKCDVYIQQNSQSTSGAVKRTWVYHQTISCRVHPSRTSKAVNVGDNKVFDVGPAKEYEENLELVLKTSIPLSKRYRVTGIKTSEGISAYQELDRYNAPDMIFEVMSSHGQVDPLGKLHFYHSTLRRVPVQDNDANYS